MKSNMSDIYIFGYATKVMFWIIWICVIFQKENFNAMQDLWWNVRCYPLQVSWASWKISILKIFDFFSNLQIQKSAYFHVKFSITSPYLLSSCISLNFVNILRKKILRLCKFSVLTENLWICFSNKMKKISRKIWPTF